MSMLVILIVAVAVLENCRAETSDLEKFLTSGFNKETTEDKEGTENAAGATENQLMDFMRRAGLLDIGDNVNYDKSKTPNTGQALNQQQATAYYLPQQSQITSYVAPKRQLEVPGQQQSLSLSSNSIPLNTNSQVKNFAASDPQQKGISQTVAKVDRQGLYGHDGALYETSYSPNHGGHGGHGGYDGYSEKNAGGYAGGLQGYSGYHAPEPVHKPAVYSPPSVAIKIDPLGLLRILLQGIPKPLLNLNGKVFFGIELGKNAGIVKGVGYAAPPPYHGGGAVLNLG